MNSDIKILDKKMLKKEILKSKIFYYWETIFPVMLAFCLFKNHAFFVGMSVVYAVINVIKVMIIIHQRRIVDKDDFFAVKSVILSEEIEGTDGSDSHYKIFKYNRDEGNIKQRVSKKIYDSYRPGDRFYLIFFKNKKDSYKCASYIFPCYEYSLDSELRLGYKDYTYEYGGENTLYSFDNEEDEFEYLNSKEEIEEKNCEDCQEIGEMRTYEEKEYKNSADEKWKSIFLVIRKIMGVFLAIASIGTLLINFNELFVKENYDVFTFFCVASVLSLLMIFSKIKLLLLLFASNLFISAGLSAILTDNDTELGGVCFGIALFIALPVLLVNLFRKKSKEEKYYGYKEEN